MNDNIVKMCREHGPRTKEQCFSTSRETKSGLRIDYACKECARVLQRIRNDAKRKPKTYQIKKCSKHGKRPSMGWLIIHGKQKWRVICKNCESERKANWDIKYPGKRATNMRAKLLKRKIEVMSIYCDGEPKCQICGINDVDLLCMDHINGDGAQHRREQLAGKGRIFIWAMNNGYPDTLQVVCHNCNMKLWRKMHPRSSGRNAKKDIRLKYQVMSHYSQGKPHCEMCGIDDVDLLTMDHIGGGGNQHRANIGVGSGARFYRWLRQMNYPDGYRVLCFNCNMKDSFQRMRSRTQ